MLKGHSQKDKLVFKTNYHLMQVKSIAECCKGSILQYFPPSLSYHLSIKCLFCLFLSGRFTQVLLYMSVCVSELLTVHAFFLPFCLQKGIKAIFYLSEGNSMRDLWGAL